MYETPTDTEKKTSDETKLLPILALVVAQLITASWHVLGKHIMHQVPYLDPISFVLFRTLLSSVALLLVGRISEGHIPFPGLFYDGSKNNSNSNSNMANSAKFHQQSSPSIAIGDSITFSSSLDLSPCAGIILSGNCKIRRRKKYGTNMISSALSQIITSTWIVLSPHEKRLNNLNSVTMRIIIAGLCGMLVVPLCYTTGLILTSPTVVSVWDGPLIPLGCFCATVAFGFENVSPTYPISQVVSLLLTVIGSIMVLLVDYSSISSHDTGDDGLAAVNRSNIISDHTKFIRGNIILFLFVTAFLAMTLLQKSLCNHPPIHLTAWMSGTGFVGCFFFLLLDGMMGNMTTGCTLAQAVSQVYIALTTCPIFRFGVLYSALFVNGACFTIGSYASSHLDSSVITLFAATQPPITAVLELVWAGHVFGPMKLGGMVCVCLGIYSFTWIKKYHS